MLQAAAQECGTDCEVMLQVLDQLLVLLPGMGELLMAGAADDQVEFLHFTKSGVKGSEYSADKFRCCC